MKNKEIIKPCPLCGGAAMLKDARGAQAPGLGRLSRLRAADPVEGLPRRGREEMEQAGASPRGDGPVRPGGDVPGLHGAGMDQHHHRRAELRLVAKRAGGRAVIRAAGGFLAGAITALAAVLAAQRLTATGKALLGMFGAGAALMAVVCVILLAPWAVRLPEDDDER